MALVLFVFLITACFMDVISSDENNGRGVPRHLLLVPARIVSGSTNKICVSRLGSAAFNRATAHIEFLTVPLTVSNHTTDRPNRHMHKYIARARKIFFQGNGGCLDVLVPRTPHLKLLLRFRMRFDDLPNYRVDERKEVALQHDSSIVIIQLDKPIYRAGEHVRLRVLQLRPDLTPLQLPVYRISIETPPTIFGGPVKVVQWYNVTTQLGVVQREYYLDKYAQQGEWRVVVDSRDSSAASTVQSFSVTDYVLPSFFISVTHDKVFLASFKQLAYSICVRYMHGEGVNGALAVTVYSDSYSSQTVLSFTQLIEERSCFNHTVRASLLGFGQGNEKPTLVIADIAFQEHGTKVWKNTTAISNLSRQVVKVNYVDKYDMFFKPGLPYKVKVRVTDWKSFPVPNAKVQFCKILNGHPEEVDNQFEPEILYDIRDSPLAGGNRSSENIFARSLMDECETGVTDTKGHVSFTFSVGAKENTEFVLLKTIVLDHPLKEFESGASDKRFASSSLKLYSWGNHSQMSMEIGSPLAGASELRIGSRHSFPVFLTMPDGAKIQPITLHYAIITRFGSIFRWGTTTQCPSTIHDVQSLERARQREQGGPAPPECPGTEPARGGTVYKMVVHMRVSHQMCPHSHLLVYHVTPKGQLVVASKIFNVDECFFNKVSQQWVPDTVPPSSPVKLQLRFPGPALCLLGVTNVAVHQVAARRTVHEQVVKRLMAFIDARYDRIEAVANEEVCFAASTQIHDDTSQQFVENTLRTFLDVGVEIMTDLLPARVPCPQAQSLSDAVPTPPQELQAIERYAKDRTYFPETWLWDVHMMESHGVLDIPVVVPDEITQWQSEVVCVSRAGVAVPQAGNSGLLKVTQPFFVELQAPRVVKRGEDVHMLYKIFNYLDQDIPVSIDLEVFPLSAASVTSFEAHKPSGKVSCVPKGRSVINHFTVKAHQLRSLNVSVAVQILNNMQHYCQQSKGDPLTTYDIRDKVVKTVLVEPEGYPVEKHKSALLCIDDITNKTDLTWNFDRINCVEHSENWFVSVVGDVTGPMVMNLDSLISLPMGCGEQNLALLAYNLIALDYAAAGKRVSADMKEKALNHLAMGYQRQLQYRHSSGAFSAFGPSDQSGSTWLTAFAVRVLAGLRAVAPSGGAGEGALVGAGAAAEAAGRWLLFTQLENGCFRGEGQVFHREMKGGLRSDTASIALAAYIVISVIDAEISILTRSNVQNVAYCLAALKYNHIQLGRSRDTVYNRNPDKMYAFALATLAQIKIEKFFKDMEHKNEVMAEKIAFKRHIQNYESNEGELYPRGSLREYSDNDNDYFNYSSASNFDYDNVVGSPMNLRYSSLYTIPERSGDKDAGKQADFLAGGGVKALEILKSLAHRDSDMIWWEAGSLSVSIETTGYAMLSLLAVGGPENILEAVAAARWLSMHRTAMGGFYSTQDTLVALQALCQLRDAMPDTPPSLSVTVRAPGRGRHFTVTPPERQKLHKVLFEAATATKLSISAEGRGCLLVQATQRYNTLSKPTQDSPFQLFSKVITDGTFSCTQKQTWCMCAAVLEVCVSWNAPSGVSFPEMALLDIRMPTGYSPDRSLLYKLIKPENLLLRRVEESPNFEGVFLYLSLQDQQSSVSPSECYSLFLVGPKAHTLPANIHVYDYYHTDTTQTMTFTIPESCPFDRDRRPHDEPMDLVTQSTQDQELDPMDGSDLNAAGGDLMVDGGDLNAAGGDLMEDQVGAGPLNVDGFGPDWHVIDMDYDLETPKTIEGVPPVFVMPPDNFNKTKFN